MRSAFFRTLFRVLLGTDWAIVDDCIPYHLTLLISPEPYTGIHPFMYIFASKFTYISTLYEQSLSRVSMHRRGSIIPRPLQLSSLLYFLARAAPIVNVIAEPTLFVRLQLRRAIKLPLRSLTGEEHRLGRLNCPCTMLKSYRFVIVYLYDHSGC